MNGSTSRTLVAALTLATVISPPTITWGETARDQAREHAQQGRSLYEEGRYEEALSAYRAAFELAPAPGVLFNLGQCYRHLGDMAQALDHYERYLSEAPTAPNRPTVEALIEQCRTHLAEEPSDTGPPELESDAHPPDVASPSDAGPQDTAAADADAGPAEGGAGRDSDADPPHNNEPATDSQWDEFYGDSEPRPPDTTSASEPGGGAATTGGDERPSRPVYRRWWFWTLIGTAVIGATVGAVVGVTTQDPTVVLPQGTLGTLDGRDGDQE